MWALVDPTGRVCEVQEETFPVHSSHTWHKVTDEVTTKWAYIDGKFLPPEIPVPVTDLYSEAVGAVIRRLMNTLPYSQLPEVKAFMDSIRP